MRHDSTPGPGAYNPSDEKIVTSSPRTKLGKGQRIIYDDSFLKRVPGPGTYDPSFMIKKKNPSYPMGIKLKNMNNKKNSFPGPQNYYPNLDTVLEKISKGYSIKGRNLAKKISGTGTTPGPGMYKSDFSTISKICTSFGKEIKSASMIKNKNISIPGPGQYEINNNNSGHLLSFQKEKRLIRDRKSAINMNPGPGSYIVGSVIGTEGVKSSFHIRSASLANHNINPGPANYNPSNKLIIQKNEDIKFSKSSKIITNKADKFPGPGKYDYEDNTTKFKKNPAFHIGHSKRENKKTGVTDSPGPGKYPIHNVSSINCPKISFHLKLNNLKSVTENPGPGTYNPNIYSTLEGIRKSSIGMKLQYNIEKLQKDIPGPGKYQTPLINTNNKGNTFFYFRFSKGSRSIILKNTVPGPGQYSIPSTVSYAPAYALPIKNKN